VRSEDILTAAKGGGVAFSGRLFEYMVRFVYGILVARVIGAEQFGLYNLAITLSLTISNMAMLGLQVAMGRFLPPVIREKDERSIWGIVQICLGLPLLCALSLAVGLFLFADPLVALLFHDARMVPLVQIVSVLIPLETLSFMIYIITISYKQPKYNAIANNVIASLVKLLLTAGFLVIGLSTKGVLIAQIIATAAGLAVMVYYVNTLFSFRRALGSARPYFGQLLRYSIPVHLGWMVNLLNGNFSTYVMGFLGLAVGVGVYTAASRFSAIGSMFYLSVVAISTPIFADLHSMAKTTQMKAYYQATTRWMMMFNLPVFLTSVIFAKPMLSIFGDDFATGASTMMILAFGTLAYTSTGFGATILDMTDHPKVNTINSVVMVFVTITLNVLLVPPWGVVGAAVASSVATILVNVVCLIEVWILVGIQPYNHSLFKPILAGLVASLVAFLLNYFIDLPSLLQLLVGGGTLWIVYGFILYLLRLPPEDRLIIVRLLSRFRVKQPATQDAIT
jgi:O-antigen/teichoic acid export membrane protein